MKRRKVLCSLLLASLAAPAIGRAQTGPVGWWKFDEGSGTTTADSSTSGNTGTLVSSPTWTGGRVGPSSLTFNGTTQSVAVSGAGSVANLYTSGVTVSAWIKPSASGGRIVDKDNNDVGWFFEMTSTWGIEFASDQFVGTEPSRTSASSVITANTWQHVAGTWDGSVTGSNIHVYINGVESATGTVISGSGTPGSDATTPLTIGNRPVDNARGFKGVIDDVRVYNRVLSLAEIQALADSTAPSTPASLTANAASSSQINLSWPASTDNVRVTGYLLERCQGASCSNFAQIATPAGTTYNDTGLAAATSYSYRVRATDANSNLSGYSSVQSATTSSGSDTQPPSAPTNLAATATSSSHVNLTWTASTDNVGVTGYRVERCASASCTNFLQIATSVSNSYADTGLIGSSSYSYRVRASDAAGNLSTYSGTQSATTPAASAGTVTYGYDAVGRLRTVTNPDTTVVAYALDAAGNRQSGTSGMPGTLQFTSATYSVAENAGSIAVSVSRVGGSFGAASLTYSTSNGTAVAGTNYSSASGTLNWASADAGTKTFTVPILDDHVYGPNLTFNVALGTPLGAGAGAQTTAVITVTNTDLPQPGTLSIAPASYSVVEANTSATVTVTRTGGSDGSVSVQYATSNGTAIAGTQYTAAQGTLTWANHDTAAKTFSVPIIYDGVGGTSETINLALSGASGNPAPSLGTSTGTITITDSEPGVLQFSASTYAVNENGGTISLPVSRTNGGYGTVTANYQTVNGTAIAGTDFTATSGTLSWASGDTASKTITVPIINGTVYAPDKSFTVSLAGPTGGATVGATNPTSVTIHNTNGPGVPPNLRASPAGLVLGGSFTVLWDTATGSINHYTLQELNENTAVTTTYTIAAPTTSRSMTKGSQNNYFDYSVRACGTSDETLCSAWDGPITVGTCPTTGCP